MEENKFEQEVQQKMEELTLRPSDAVWSKIASRIEKKKSSKRGFLWLLLSCGFLLGGYLVWTATRPIMKNDKTGSPITFKKNTDSPSVPDNRKVDPNAAVNATQLPATAQAQPELADIHTPSQSHDANASGKISLQKNTIAYNTPVKKTAGNSGSPASPITVQTQPEVKLTGGNTDTTVADPTPVQSRPNELSKNTLKNESTLKDTARQQQQPPSKSTVHDKKRSWQFGVLFTGGISGVGNKFLTLDNSIPAAYLNFTGQVSPPMVNNRFVPTKTSSGFGFMAGLSAEKNIAGRIKLVTGINITSFATVNRVGLKNDSSGYYSSSTASTRHVSHFNYIAIPVAIKFQIGRSKSVPFFWEGGAVISRLISGNALQFDQGTGYYYTDNSFLNKTQIGVNTSFTAAFLCGKKTSVVIGPYFYFGASKLANDGLYNSRHFVFTGLRSQLMLGK
jgi:Outer membrane protein beta-barrel domain